MSFENAGIFFYHSQPSAAALAEHAATADATASVASESHEERIGIAWPDVKITISIDERWNRAVQIAGMKRWIGQFPEEERTPEHVQLFVRRLDDVEICYGSVTEPSFDREGKVLALLLRLIKGGGGFIVCAQGFYDDAGRKIIGLPEAPDLLGQI